MANKIGESELIITPRGSVYHIDLKKDELANTVITVGDPDRVPAVSKYFDSIEFKTQHREFVTHTGYIGKKRITVISSGIGPDNIDIVLNELDAVVNIDLETRTILPKHTSLNIIRMGTCGSLQADVPVDSMVVGTHGIGLDNVLHYYTYEHSAKMQQLVNEFSNFTLLYKSAIQPYAVAAAAELIPLFDDRYVKGITVTCPGFYAPQGRVVRAALAFPQLVEKFSQFKHEQTRIVNFEMETSAIYGLGNVLGHKCLSINTVVANRQTKTFSNDGKKAVDNMIQKSLEILANLPN
jgi:uridine phosphorylase